MKKILLTTVTLTALVAPPALAADVGRPVYRAPPPAPVYPVYGFSWTGCYVGGHIGGLWAHKEWFDRDPFSVTFGQSEGTHDPSGLLGGVQAGCDYQFAWEMERNLFLEPLAGSLLDEVERGRWQRSAPTR